MAEEMRYIVRIASMDLNGSLSIERSLRGIKGIGHRMAGIIANEFEKQTKVSSQKLIGELPEDFDSKLEEIVYKALRETQIIPMWESDDRDTPRYGIPQSTTATTGAPEASSYKLAFGKEKGGSSLGSRRVNK